MRPLVLVAYGSRNGATAAIASRLGDDLRAHGCEADVRPAADVDDITRYDAVIIGGALCSSHWHGDARRLAARARWTLRHRPVWLFSSGPLDTSAAEHDIPPVPFVRRTATRIGARGHVTFGGCLGAHPKGWPARAAFNSGRGGDFRDVGRIDAWAETIAHEVVTERTTA
ncbi:flavodoxin domain-containing protein [Streptomyces sp. VRA16 Mangrove soil]|nr:flavodoxin domain-containing protein [Streptomyces sp. VRA16 Mangrove soil]